MDDIQAMLDERIRELIDKLETLKAGTPEYKAVSDELQKLHQLRIDEIKSKLAEDEFKAKHEAEVEKNKQDSINEAYAKKQEHDLAKKDLYFKIALGTLDVVGSMAMFWICFNKGLQFEETGTLSTPEARNMSNKLMSFLKIRK